jgi:hypothetical protein
MSRGDNALLAPVRFVPEGREALTTLFQESATHSPSYGTAQSGSSQTAESAQFQRPDLHLSLPDSTDLENELEEDYAEEEALDEEDAVSLRAGMGVKTVEASLRVYGRRSQWGLFLGCVLQARVRGMWPDDHASLYPASLV